MPPATRVLDSPSLVMVRVRQLPEGVYLGVSDDLPGLIIEAESREELIDEAREMAQALLEESGDEFRLKGLKLAFVFD